MLQRSYKSIQSILLPYSVRCFSTGNERHSRIAIVGGGTAGMTVSAQLIREKIVKPEEITVFDPSKIHYYQPTYTMIGGGLLGESFAQINKNSHLYKKKMTEVLNPKLNLVDKRITSYDPENNAIFAGDDKFTYDYLIVAPGVQLRYEKVPGLLEALQDENVPVGNIYDLPYAFKIHRLREKFEGGKAIFTQPPLPFKCGGAPQKIAYLSEASWVDKGIRDKTDIEFYSADSKIFVCEKYARELQKIANARNIKTNFKHNLVKVDGTKRVATFQNLDTKEEKEVNFDLLHAVPPMDPPKSVKESPLVNPAGFVEVSKATTQHVKYPNVFSIGDCSNLPTSKTAAAIFSQAPVLVHNLKQEMNKKKLNASFTGYTSCPLLLGHNSLMLAEFKYDTIPDETFFKSQDKYPNYLFYALKRHILPRAYFNLAPKGLWYGRRGIFKPVFREN